MIAGDKLTTAEKREIIKTYCKLRKYCIEHNIGKIGSVQECPLYNTTCGVFNIEGLDTEQIDHAYKLLEDSGQMELHRDKTGKKWPPKVVVIGSVKNVKNVKGVRIEELQATGKEPEGAQPDLVHHPAHYCYSEYEPKDVIRAWGLNFNLGSAVKYIARAGRKDDILQELNKAKQFIEFEIEAIEKERAGDER